MAASKFLRRTAKAVAWTAGLVVLVAVGAVVWFVMTVYPASDPYEGVLALTGATVLLGPELEPLSDATVLIEDGRIAAAGTDVEVPAGAEVIALNGATLMPGLIDAHVHFGAAGLESEPGPIAIAGIIVDTMRYFPERRRILLEHGVTTIRSLGDEHEWIVDGRRQLDSGELEGPRLFVAGPLFTTPGGHPVKTFGSDPEGDSVRLPDSPGEARRMVRALTRGDRKVDVIKVVQERGGAQLRLQPIDPEVLNAIVDEAHQHDTKVVAHWGDLQDLEEVLAAGVDALEHIDSRELLDGWPSGLVDRLVREDILLTPTLAVSAVKLDQAIMDQLQRRTGEFYAAGGRLVVGSDAGVPGVGFGSGVHDELARLVASGLTPRQALQAATVEAAGALGSDSIGVIEEGRAADLVVVDGDPLEEVAAAGKVMMVFRDGRMVVDRRDEG